MSSAGPETHFLHDCKSTLAAFRAPSPLWMRLPASSCIVCTVHAADGWPRARCGNRSLDATKWNRGPPPYAHDRVGDSRNDRRRWVMAQMSGPLCGSDRRRRNGCWGGRRVSRRSRCNGAPSGNAPSAASAVFRVDWYKKMRWILVRIEAQSAAIASYGEHLQRRVGPKDAHFCTKKSETLH